MGRLPHRPKEYRQPHLLLHPLRHQLPHHGHPALPLARRRNQLRQPARIRQQLHPHLLQPHPRQQPHHPALLLDRGCRRHAHRRMGPRQHRTHQAGLSGLHVLLRRRARIRRQRRRHPLRHQADPRRQPHPHPAPPPARHRGAGRDAEHPRQRHHHQPQRHRQCAAEMARGGQRRVEHRGTHRQRQPLQRPHAPNRDRCAATHRGILHQRHQQQRQDHHQADDRQPGGLLHLHLH